MRWYKETFYVQRDESTGAIIRLQEDKPAGYMSSNEERRSKASKASIGEVEKDIKEYAKLKAKKKRLAIGD